MNIFQLWCAHEILSITLASILQYPLKSAVENECYVLRLPANKISSLEIHMNNNKRILLFRNLQNLYWSCSNKLQVWTVTRGTNRRCHMCGCSSSIQTNFSTKWLTRDKIIIKRELSKNSKGKNIGIETSWEEFSIPCKFVIIIFVNH